MTLAVAAAAHDGTRAVITAAIVAYGFVYLYGLASLTVFAATLRAIAEHQTGADDALDEGRAALPNFRSGPLSRLVFGSYGFSNHATHHRRPSVPHYRLAEVTAALAADEPALRPATGYVATLRRLRREHRRSVPRVGVAPRSTDDAGQPGAVLRTNCSRAAATAGGTPEARAADWWARSQKPSAPVSTASPRAVSHGIESGGKASSRRT